MSSQTETCWLGQEVTPLSQDIDAMDPTACLVKPADPVSGIFFLIHKLQTLQRSPQRML